MKQKILYLLVGPAGAGKSTWLAEHQQENAKYISRDGIRFQLVKEDEPYFSREDEVFDLYIQHIQLALQMHTVNAVYCDATHLNEKARNKVLDRLDLSDVAHIYALVFMPALDEVLRRNAQRTGRERVPDDVIKRMYRSYTDPATDKKYFITPYYIEKAMTIPESIPEKKIWVTSDLHFGHDREFVFKPRGFSTIQEMNEAIIKRWNEVVGPDDDVYVLGDLMLGDSETGAECIKKLAGTLHIVLGNHDTDNRVKLYYQLPNVAEVALALKLKYKKHHFFMTHYPCLTGNLEKEALTQMTLNLYGHTHQRTNFFNDLPYIFHVGVDSHNCYPVLLDDIIKEMHQKVEECKSFL